MDGFELAQLMRGMERTRQIPIVFITAGTRDQQRLFEGYSLGAVDFLYKPIEAHILKSKVDIFVQLYRQKQDLATQLHLNEMLTAVIGHDLRNPLQTIIGGASILKKSTDDRVRWAADRIQSSGARMTKLIADLLDFSSARLKGALPVDPVQTNILDLTRKVVAEHELADTSARIEIQQVGEFDGLWDESRMSQALSNLIGNALTHGDRTEPIRIFIDGGAPDTVTLSVTNKGTIPPAALPHIFDPFQSSLEKRTGASGLGLGLYIVQQIVNTHGGLVSVESTPATGTSFTVFLPRNSHGEIARTPRAITA
jgi:two-component system sensor histidine kinase/response regulator